MKQIVANIKCALNGKYTVEEVERDVEPVEEEPIVREPTEQEDIAAMLIDQEYRLTLLELGVE